MDATLQTESLLHTPGHKPESNDFPTLKPREASLFCALVGSANWLITLGRFDVAFAAMQLAHFAAVPHKGHTKEIKRVFGHMKHHPGGKIFVDNSMPDHSHCQMEKFDWTQFCPAFNWKNCHLTCQKLAENQSRPHVAKILILLQTLQHAIR